MKQVIVFFGSQEVYEAIQNRISSTDSYVLLPYSEKREKIIRLAFTYQADVVVSLLSWLDKDKFEILNAFKGNLEKGMKSVVLADSVVDGLLKNVLKYNIDYLMQSAFDYSLLVQELDVLTEAPSMRKKWINLENEVCDVLKDLGIPSNLKGYSYLKTAIIATVKNEGYVEKITKILYPDIAHMYHTTTARVEKAIRHAVEISFFRADSMMFDELFGFIVDENKAKPTNSEFISMIATNLRQE